MGLDAGDVKEKLEARIAELETTLKDVGNRIHYVVARMATTHPERPELIKLVGEILDCLNKTFK